MKKLILLSALSCFTTLSFADQHILDLNYSQEQSTNDQPDWKVTELGYTQKNDQNTWQVLLRNYDRYNLNDNQIEVNASHLIHENQENKTLLSYAIAAGDLNNKGYLPEIKAGFSLQQSNKNWIASPIFDYQHTKYKDSNVNYYGLSTEKYIQNWRLLAGIWLSDTSFYKPTTGFKAQVSYYIPHSDNSISYYFSDGKEPEVTESSTRIYHITSHALTSKIFINQHLSTNIGLTHTIYHGNYSRTGVLAGISYDF